MATEEYSWPASLLTRYQYLEYAGNCHLEATEPERIEHNVALVNSKLVFSGDVTDRVKRISDRHTDLTSLHRHLAQLERKYLRDFHQVLNDAQIAHVKAIAELADAYAASQKFWQVEDDFPRWPYIQSHVRAAESLFGLMASEAPSLFISNAADEWHRHHQRLSAALKQTADIRKKMRHAISVVRQRERDARLDHQGTQALGAANDANQIASAANSLAEKSNQIANDANTLSQRALDQSGRSNKIAKRTAIWTGLGVLATAIPATMALFGLHTLQETVEQLKPIIQQDRTTGTKTKTSDSTQLSTSAQNPTPATQPLQNPKPKQSQ